MVSREKKIELRRQRRQKIASIVLAIIMVFGIIGFAFQGNLGTTGTGTIELNGFEFTQQAVDGGSVLVTEVNGQEYAFYSNPFEAQNVVTPANFSSELNNAASISFALGEISDDEQQQAIEQALITDFSTVSSASIEQAQVPGSERDGLAPVRTCDDADSENLVFLLNETEGSLYAEIEKRDDYCYSIKAYGFDLLVIRDYFMLEGLNII